MEISPSKFAAFLSGIISLVLVGGMFYFCYILFFSNSSYVSGGPVTTSDILVFGPKMRAAVVVADPQQKLSFSSPYIDTLLFKSFSDKPEVVPLTDSRGRPDPFVPYVAP